MDFKMKKIGLIVAMPEEVNEILNELGELTAEITESSIKLQFYNTPEREIILAICGIGIINATIATTLVIQNGASFIINCGLVGGLNSSLTRNETVLVSEIVHSDVDFRFVDGIELGRYPDEESFVMKCDSELLALADRISGNDLSIVRLASSDKFIASDEMKNFLIDNFQADICDMEAAGILRVAKMNKIPALFIKHICDSANDNAVDDYYDIKCNTIDQYKHLIKNVISYL